MARPRSTIGEEHKSDTGRVRQRPLTPGRKALFLKELARHGVAAEAARAASPHSRDRHGASGTFYAERNRDPAFALAWDTAVEEADARLEVEAVRRAVDGVQVGVFQRGVQAVCHDGRPATVTEYSDRLLEVLLRARIPNRYADRKQVDVNGSVNVNHTVQQRLYLAPSDLMALGAEDRRQLMRILETVARNRGEISDTISGRPALPSGDAK